MCRGERSIVKRIYSGKPGVILFKPNSGGITFRDSRIASNYVGSDKWSIHSARNAGRPQELSLLDKKNVY